MKEKSLVLSWDLHVPYSSGSTIHLCDAALPCVWIAYASSSNFKLPTLTTQLSETKWTVHGGNVVIEAPYWNRPQPQKVTRNSWMSFTPNGAYRRVSAITLVIFSLHTTSVILFSHLIEENLWCLTRDGFQRLLQTFPSPSKEMVVRKIKQRKSDLILSVGISLWGSLWRKKK